MQTAISGFQNVFTRQHNIDGAFDMIPKEHITDGITTSPGAPQIDERGGVCATEIESTEGAIQEGT